MKRFKYIFFYISFLLLVVLMASCKKSFLEITPKGKLIASTVNDYDLMLNTIELLNSSANPQIPMGDEAVAFQTYFSSANVRAQRLFQWADDIYPQMEDAPEFTGPMGNLYTYNKIINEVPNAAGGPDRQKASIQAEALAGRAWIYFLMINLYGKPYHASTANNDPGFPIIMTADVTVNSFKRASVQEVYAFIINDLQKAIPALPAQLSNRTRMSKAAAEALLGKVYVFMGNFSDAQTQLTAALNDLQNSPAPVGLYDYNTEFASGGVFLPVDFFGPAYPLLPNNKESIYARQVSNDWAGFDNTFLISPETAALFKPSDLRLNFLSTGSYPAGSPFPKGMQRRLGPFSQPFGFILPDLYLLKAECEARNNNLNAAVTDLEILRKSRMPAADAAVPANTKAEKMALVRYILDERIREFALEGFRWFDMRRLSVDPLFANSPAAVHQVYDDSGAIATTYTLRPERLTLRLPTKVIAANPGMTDNP
jgi:hypothetical protein